MDYNMEKACFSERCAKEVAFVCVCEGKPTYFCKKHYFKHSSLQNEHTIKSLLVIVPQTQALECLLKALKALKHLKVLENDLLSQSDKIISQLTDLTKKVIKNIRETERWLQLFLGKVYLGKK